MSTFLAVFGNIMPTGTQGNTITYHFYEKSSRAELFRCGNCESPRGDLSFHTKFLARKVV